MPTTTQTDPYDAKGIHRAELVYSTPFSSLLGLHKANQIIHSIPSLPYPLEFIVFLFGYAFNPVSMVPWTAAITKTGAVSYSSQQSNNIFFAPVFYLATVLATLMATEGCKFSFRASRPEAILSNEFRYKKCNRRFGSIVGSLKSKHSFPSGDSAQALNLVLFWYFYIAPQFDHGLLWEIFAFGVFYPAVAFARVFYHCHWMEDTLAGGLLALFLHRCIMPSLSDLIWTLMENQQVVA